MIELVYSPRWFFGRDITIDVISMLVLLIIIATSIKYYKISKKKKYLAFGFSFFLLFLSFLSKILMNFTVYSEKVDTVNAGFATLTYERIISSDNLFFIGFLSYRLLMLFGLYLLHSVYHKQPKSNIFLIFYLLIVSTYFSHSEYYVFHLTSLLLLVLITLQYLRTYRKIRHITTKYLTYSFSVITLSNILFIFIKINNIFYVIAEFIQLVGYICLLLTFIAVFRHAKKKNED